MNTTSQRWKIHSESRIPPTPQNFVSVTWIFHSARSPCQKVELIREISWMTSWQEEKHGSTNFLTPGFSTFATSCVESKHTEKETVLQCKVGKKTAHDAAI